MLQFNLFFIFLLIGIVGAIGHWAKKRYLDKTTTDSLLTYIKHDPKTTAKALLGVAGTAYTIAVSHHGGYADIQLSEVGMALGLSYASDSGLNKASDS